MRQILNASRVEQLCKSIVMVNTQASEDITDCSNPKNSKYYVVVVQYMARLNAESIKNFLYALNDKKVPKKRFNMRLAPEDESLELTGFIHNAVTCIGMQTDIPVIIDEAITKLEEDYFWLGGGEVDLKLGMKTSQFLSAFKPFVVKCS
ncbi:YbaK/aminoacyl-tRNA synthetase-associated domain-containing protein [Rhynchospora pubera]|uniref:YbaK/aminoacyl-tRNA synthetase-associated domain-containing protein n=1 Tax=Rhynchospora pubera TaxID=906938 RepID=A0AAV8CWC4_9POAL|nr:YbaK/aminoacyl-tRNA synthetase-associated domain-containing protein [Rhynchospora pubera]